MSREFYLGIDVGGTAVKFVLTDQGGDVICDGEVATQPSDPEASLRSVAAAAGSLIGDPSLCRLAAVGIACAGIVNPQTGHLGRSPNLPGWENTLLDDDLKRVFGDVPRTLANDVNGALYGEYRRGAGHGCRNLIMIALGTGVGGGVILNGNLVLGTHCGAGEIGHMVLNPEGLTCACGGTGCLEAYAGSVGILSMAREASGSKALSELIRDSGDRLTTADLAELANNGDESAKDIFAAAGRWLGQAIGNLVNLLDPDKVIIGGGVARAGELILGPCREVVPGLVLAAEAKQVPIVPAQLGNWAAARGVASLAREKENTG